MLVDKILECEPGKRALGVKCVSANEMHFNGHFPEMSIMPGVLIIEAMAQTGAVAILSSEDNKGKIAVLGGIKDAKIKRQVRPGDVLTMDVELTRSIGNIGRAEGIAKVDGELVCEMKLTFALTETEQ